MDYGAALKRAEALQAAEASAVNPLCRTRVLVHGARSRHAAVLYHGITNCPQQFEAFGELLFERGYNVLIPRYPHHGLNDRLTDEQRLLTATELRRFAIHTCEIGRGLGEHVSAIGLSLGGVVASWLAQEERIDLAMPISSLFALPRVPVGLTRTIAVAARHLPNLFLWWDPRQKQDLKPSYGYPRFSTHAFAAMLELGRDVQGQARRRRPQAAVIVAVTNANDPAVNNRGTDRLIRTWRERWAEPVVSHEFAAELGLPHDLIDPGNPEQNVALVYPVLLDLLERTGIN